MYDEFIHSEHDLGNGLRGKIVYDQHAEPWDGDEPGEIAYLKRSRECLGTEAVSEDRMDEIAAGIRSGEYLGLPVYAYVHGGATIRCGDSNPFNCQWDSGMSGFVYCDPVKAKEEFGFESDEHILEALRHQVKLHDNYLTGEVFGYVVFDEDDDNIESCWGYYGDDEIPYMVECMQSIADAINKDREEQRAVEAAAQAAEEAEVEYWAARDVLTA
jgi:hypothetical protein